MTGSFSEYREEVRRATRIVELLSSRGITVGRNNKASCPFHDDGATPNLHVYDEHVYCFSCHAYADVFGIVEKLDHASHREAVDRLARDAGMSPWGSTPHEEERAQRGERRRAMLAAAAEHYRGHLTREHREYLRGRGVTDEQIEATGFGTATGQLATHLRQLGFKDDEMCATAETDQLGAQWLAKRTENGVLRDFYWPGLLIIPIVHRGRVVGFTARNFSAAPDAAKYIHLPGPTTPFGLDTLRTGKCAVVVEGAFDVLGVERHGYPAVALLGTSINDALVQRLRPFKSVYVALDGDAAGRARAIVVAKAIGTRARIALLPHGKDPDDVTKEEFDAAIATARDVVLHKVDQLESNLGPVEAVERIKELGLIQDLAAEDDLLRNAHTDEIGRRLGFNKTKVELLRSSLRKLLADARKAAPANSDSKPLQALYTVRDGSLFHSRDTRDGPVDVLLTNFDARIVADIVENDGVETRRLYEVTATQGGKARTFRVPASEFANMNWVMQELGPKAIVSAGMSSRDHARAAIQTLSGVPAERQVFTHTGWATIEGEPVYLHAGGGIGAEGVVVGVEVRLDSPLDRYELPAPAPSTLAADVAASLRMLDVAPFEITVPLYAAIYRAVIAPNDLSIHVVGMTGVFKTEIAALMQRHFGPAMDAEHLPAAWSGTGNSLEMLGFLAKDVPLVVDDFVPDADPARLHREAARLFRGKGNCAGRSRLRQDATVRPPKPARALIVSTGEDTPRGVSLRARMIIVEVPPDAVCATKLTACQSDAADGAYARVTARFVQWFAPRRARFLKELETRVRDLRAVASGAGMHRKTPDAIANLQLGLDVFVEFAVDVNAITKEAANALLAKCKTALQNVARAQSEHHAAADPVDRFLALLRAALTSGAAHLCAPDGAEPTGSERWGWSQAPTRLPRGARIGWIDGFTICLDFQATYQVVMRGSTDSADPLGVSAHAMKKRLAERELIETEQRGAQRHLEVRRTLQGVRRPVVALRADAVFGSPEPANDYGQVGQGETKRERSPTSKPTDTSDFSGNCGVDAQRSARNGSYAARTCPSCPTPEASPSAAIDQIDQLEVSEASSDATPSTDEGDGEMDAAEGQDESAGEPHLEPDADELLERAAIQAIDGRRTQTNATPPPPCRVVPPERSSLVDGATVVTDDDDTVEAIL